MTPYTGCFVRCFSGLQGLGLSAKRFMFGVWGLGFFGLGFRVWGLGFGVWGLGFGVWGLGFFGLGFCGLGFGVWGLGFGVWGLGFFGLGFGVWGCWGFWGLGRHRVIPGSRVLLCIKGVILGPLGMYP